MDNKLEVWIVLFLSLAVFLWYTWNQFFYLLAAGYQLLGLLASFVS
jgi:hypothetical protein